MASSQTETVVPSNPKYSGHQGRVEAYQNYGKLEKTEGGVIEVVGESNVSYPKYLPTWDTKLNLPAWEDFEHVDPGSRADPSLPNLFPKGAKFEKSDLTPKLGTEVHGIQLSKLSDKAKDELALYVAQRGVVAFRDQDFADLPIDEAIKYSEHFGPAHIHPTAAHPLGHHKALVVHRSQNEPNPKVFQVHTSSVNWHSDVSYEKQPPGTTFLYLLDGPESGGDTAFSDQFESFDRLSEGFQQRLEGLRALHSGYEQYEEAKQAGLHIRRDPVAHYHPIVRTHPVLKRKGLFVNTAFTRSIEGFKKEESDALLNFLYDHNAKGVDFQVRVKWAKGTVVVWDNRRVLHSALLDWNTPERRHLARLTPRGEVPS